jgi:hypothetical protein
MSTHRCVFLLTLIGVAFLLVPSRLAEASGEWQPIDPAELKMTSEPLAPGAPAIFLYRQVDRKDLGKANMEYNYVRIKILTEEGRKYANVELPYSKQNGGIVGVKGRTIHSDGSIVNFDGKTYDQMIVKAKGTKYLAKTFTMPDVQVGSIIEYHYNIDFADGFVFDSTWILSEELFTKKANFILVPYDRFMIRWSWPSGLPAGTEPPKQGPDKIVRMTAQNIPAFQIEDYMPPENELKFRVHFSYSEDGFESDQDKFWTKYGKKTNGRIESFVGKRKAMEQAVSGIVSANDPPEVKLRKIYDRCQQVRNLSYETRKTEQEAKRDLKENRDVEDLWKNGYGYGGQITWLFLALARAAGFDAYPVMVSGRSEYFFNPVRMNSDELNSNVVLVKLNGKDLYFDPGAAFTPYGLLMWQESGVGGRKLDRDGGSWVQTELAPSSASKIQRKAELTLTPEGTLEGKVTISFTGLEALGKRSEERNEDDTARKKSLEDQFKEDIPVAADVTLTNQPDWKSSETPLVAEFDVKIDGWVSAAGHRAILPVGLFSVGEKHVFEHSNRVQPVYFRYAFTKEDHIAIQIPNGWQITTVPEPQDRDANAAEYILKVDNQKNAVHISRSLRVDLFMVPRDTYPALRTFYQVVRTGDEQQVVLQPGATAAGK